MITFTNTKENGLETLIVNWLVEHFEQNIFSVTRQLCYSFHKSNMHNFLSKFTKLYHQEADAPRKVFHARSLRQTQEKIQKALE